MTFPAPDLTNRPGAFPIPGLVDRATVDRLAGTVVNDQLEAGLKDLDQVRGLNDQAAAYYDGDIQEVFASARLRRAMARSGIKFRFNFAKTPVDSLTDRLEIAAVRSTNPGAAAALTRTWEVNQLDLEAPNIHRRAGEFGDAYVIVWPRDTDTDLPDDGVDADASPADVGIYYNSPDCVRLFYDQEAPLRKEYAIKRWQRADKRYRVDLLYADRIERYLSRADGKGEHAADYERHIVDWEDGGTGGTVPVWPADNPFGEVPVFHFRNDRPYGQPEHRGFYGPQDAINKLVISHMAGVDYQSFPQRYALIEADGDTSEAADVDEDDFAVQVGGEDGASSTGGDEARSQFTSDPGSVWMMKGVKGVGQFETADPDAFLKPMERYLRFGAQICTTPLRMFDYERAQLPSGQSQVQADGPFVKKVRNRQLSYGGTWRDLFTFALRVMGISGVDVSVLWAPPHTVDDEAGWKTIILKIEAGVPFGQAMREAGYTSDEVDEWAAQREAKDDGDGD